MVRVRSLHQFPNPLYNHNPLTLPKITKRVITITHSKFCKTFYVSCCLFFIEIIHVRRYRPSSVGCRIERTWQLTTKFRCYEKQLHAEKEKHCSATYSNSFQRFFRYWPTCLEERNLKGTGAIPCPRRCYISLSLPRFPRTNGSTLEKRPLEHGILSSKRKNKGDVSFNWTC